MKKKATKKVKKGFTLIELLVVIAIIAILSVVVVLTLNPAEMLRRSRDSNRTSDLSMIKTAIGLYLADVSTTNMGVSATCYYQFAPNAGPGANFAEFASNTVESGANTIVSYSTTTATACSQWFQTATATSIASTSRTVGVGGWIPINLNLVSSGAPIGQWPADPAFSYGTTGNCAANTCNGFAGHFYSYIPGASNNSYKLAAKMESSLYSQGGTGDVESTDGGTDQDMYEQGTNLAL